MLVMIILSVGSRRKDVCRRAVGIQLSWLLLLHHHHPTPSLAKLRRAAHGRLTRPYTTFAAQNNNCWEYNVMIIVHSKLHIMCTLMAHSVSLSKCAESYQQEWQPQPLLFPTALSVTHQATKLPPKISTNCYQAPPAIVDTEESTGTHWHAQPLLAVAAAIDDSRYVAAFLLLLTTLEESTTRKGISSRQADFDMYSY